MNKSFLLLLFLLFDVGALMTHSFQSAKAQNVNCQWETVHICPQMPMAQVEMTVQNANGITAIALSFEFDPAVLNYYMPFYVNPKLYNGSGVSFSQSIPGHMSFAWYSLTPTDFGNDSLFIFWFTYYGGVSAINFDTSQPGNCEFVGTPIPPNNPPVLPVVFINGLVDNQYYGISVTSQPQDTTLCPGDAAVFTTAHQNATTFQWKCSTNGSTSYADLVDGTTYSGVNSPELHILKTNAAMNGNKYMCLMSNPCYNEYTAAATLHLLPELIIETSADTISSNGPFITGSVTVMAGTPPFSYLWSNGLTTPSFTLPLYNNAQQIITVNDGSGCTKTDSINIDITNNSKTIAPTDTACPGVVIIPVALRHVNNIASASLSLEFDENVLTYVSYQNLYGDVNLGTVIDAAINGKLQFAWYSIYPVTIDSGNLVEFVFQGIPGTSPLSWDVQTQGSCQYTDLGLGNLPVQFIDGSVYIGGCGSISGDVTYDNLLSTPLTNTTVELWQGGTAIRDQVTNAQGEFSIDGVLNRSYEVRALSDKAWGGGNSVDALSIMKYFAGIVPLSGMKLQAADVNLSGNVNAVDALQISKRFVGLNTSFDSGDWLFTHDSVDIYNNNAIVHLKGICYGDVNGSYNPEAKEGEPPLMRCSGELVQQNPGIVSIPLRAEQEALIASVSLIMRFPSDLIRIRSVHMAGEENLVYHIDGDQLRLSWYSLKPLPIGAGETLFVLDCDITCNDYPLQASFVAESGTLITDFAGNAIPGIQFSYPAIIQDKGQAQLGQNIPNPFSGNTTIPYYLPVSGHIRLSVTDLPGREILLLVDENMPEGSHEVILSKTSLGSGIYFYRLECIDNGEVRQFTRKMMIK